MAYRLQSETDIDLAVVKKNGLHLPIVVFVVRLTSRFQRKSKKAWFQRMNAVYKIFSA